tara:strand:+ start:1285 stop:1452 length:168 start_codon:yes stop_codon:yes gene_type:complete
MEISDSTKDQMVAKLQKETKKQYFSRKDAILCIHCKRTALNGIRCLGMCVADNDY